MGLLDSLGAGIQGLLGNPDVRNSLLTSLAVTGPNSEERMALLMRQKAIQEEAKKAEELRQLQLEAYRRQMAQEDKLQQKDDITGAMIQSMNAQVADAVSRLRSSLSSNDMAGAQKARDELAALQSPEAQQIYRGHVATQGNPEMAMQAGLIPPPAKEYAPPEIVKVLAAAGIDPSSEQGKQILLQHAQQTGASGATPSLFAPTVVANPDGTGFSLIQVGNQPGMQPVQTSLAGVPIGADPNTARNMADAKLQGKTDAETRAGIPGALSTLNEIRGALDKLSASPGLENAYGAFQGRVASVRQDTINAELARDRLIGLLSLQAREKLRGSGAISDFESRTLKDSVSTLANPLLGDAEVQAEIARITEILNGADARLRAQGERLNVTPSSPQRLRYNPQTGAFE